MGATKMIKIEFPSDRKDLAAAFGIALMAVAEDEKPQPIVQDDEQEKTPAENTAADTFGVPFNSEYCASAKDPLYTCGPLAGKWKKKRGVSEEAYLAWHNSVSNPPAAEEKPVETAAAFEEPELLGAPENIGGFFSWVSERLGSGQLSQDQVDQAYIDCGLNKTSLFAPTPPAQIVANIANLWGSLNG